MDNYENTLETERPRTTEDGFTKSVEEYTAAVPSSAYLGVAVGAMALAAVGGSASARPQLHRPMGTHLADHRRLQQARQTRRPRPARPRRQSRLHELIRAVRSIAMILVLVYRA